MDELADRIRAQRAILSDPFRFADEMWERVFANHSLVDLCCDVAERPTRQDCDDARRLIERAVATPGANVQVGIDYLGDLITAHACDMEEVGRRQGVILEQLRQAMVAYIAESDCGDRGKAWAGNNAEELREEHRRLDELATGEGQTLVDLREQLAATGRLTDPANDGADVDDEAA